MVEAREARLAEALRYSAEKLKGMEEFGYSWENCHPMPPSKVEIALGSSKSPIALDSTSDSEDNIPLAKRVNNPTSQSPLSEEDVPLARRMPGLGSAAQSSKAQATVDEQDVQREPPQHQDTRNSASAEPRRVVVPGDGRDGERETKRVDEKPRVWENITQRYTEAQSQPRKVPPKRNRPSGPSPAEAVIDLDSDLEMTPLSPPPKTGFGVTKLKTLQRTNPQLGKAVSQL